MALACLVFLSNLSNGCREGVSKNKNKNISLGNLDLHLPLGKFETFCTHRFCTIRSYELGPVPGPLPHVNVHCHDHAQAAARCGFELDCCKVRKVVDAEILALCDGSADTFQSSHSRAPCMLGHKEELPDFDDFDDTSPERSTPGENTGDSSLMEGALPTGESLPSLTPEHFMEQWFAQEARRHFEGAPEPASDAEAALEEEDVRMF